MENTKIRSQEKKVMSSKGMLINTLLKITLVFVIAQQIYYPQELQYFHLALVFVYMIFLEFFKDDHWAFYEVLSFIGAILLTSIISIADKFVDLSLGRLYLIALIVGIGFTFNLVLKIYKGISKEQYTLFAPSHQKMFNKGTSLIKFLALSILGVLIVACLYSLYKLVL